jgi:uncharacterized protein (DUF1778 family)
MSARFVLRLNAEERDWVEHAASLVHQSMTEYIRRAINMRLRREGVDAVLLRQDDDSRLSAILKGTT